MHKKDKESKKWVTSKGSGNKWRCNTLSNKLKNVKGEGSLFYFDVVLKEYEDEESGSARSIHDTIREDQPNLET